MKIKTENENIIEIIDNVTRKVRRQANSTMNIMKMRLRQDAEGFKTDFEPIEFDITKAEDDKINAFVISVNGKKENILEECLNLPDDDFELLMKRIGYLLGETEEGKKELKKKMKN